MCFVFNIMIVIILYCSNWDIGIIASEKFAAKLLPDLSVFVWSAPHCDSAVLL